MKFESNVFGGKVSQCNSILVSKTTDFLYLLKDPLAKSI